MRFFPRRLMLQRGYHGAGVDTDDICICAVTQEQELAIFREDAIDV